MWLACVIFRDTQVHTLQQNVSLHLRTEAGVKMKSMLFCAGLRLYSNLAKDIRTHLRETSLRPLLPQHTTGSGTLRSRTHIKVDLGVFHILTA